MQLTKDDIKTIGDTAYIDMGKVFEVVAFYEKYKDLYYDKNDRERMNLIEQWHQSTAYENNPSCEGYTSWLFNYCFVEGLK